MLRKAKMQSSNINNNKNTKVTKIAQYFGNTTIFNLIP